MNERTSLLEDAATPVASVLDVLRGKYRITFAALCIGYLLDKADLDAAAGMLHTLEMTFKLEAQGTGLEVLGPPCARHARYVGR